MVELASTALAAVAVEEGLAVEAYRQRVHQVVLKAALQALTE
jgi:hypothetical protein